MSGFWKPDLVLTCALGYDLERLEAMLNDDGTVSLITCELGGEPTSDFVLQQKDIPSLIKVLEEAYAK